MDARNPSEQFLAKLAARFPDLVDPSCDRAKKIAFMSEEGDCQELLDWLREELKEFTIMASTPVRGAVPRIGRLLLDRARKGKPISPYRKA